MENLFEHPELEEKIPLGAEIKFEKTLEDTLNYWRDYYKAERSSMSHLSKLAE